MEQRIAQAQSGSRRVARGQGGFTLIEALVVVALMAILGGIAVFAVTALNQDANETACRAERESIITAMWAAHNTGNVSDTYGDYLSVSPKYWSNATTPPASPAWGPGTEHPGGACPSTIPIP